MSLLEAKDLEIKIGSKTIIKDFNWQIEPGENWVLFGLNGCGKTTLLSYLAGYMLAEEGKIKLFGENITAQNQKELRRRVGWVSSSFFGRYLRYETVLEIVLAGKYGMLGQQEWVGDDDVKKAKKLLKKFDLAQKSRYPYDTLSKGQQQKVLIARALMNEAEILFLDEPCGGMDILAREYFLQLIGEIAAEKQTAIVYVTHHTEEILPFFNKAMLMQEGRIHSAGNLKDIFTNENLSDFLGIRAELLWAKKHFFINLDTGAEQSEWSFI